MFRELRVTVGKTEYDVGCIVPSRLFPLPRVAIRCVSPVADDEALVPLLFGTTEATRIRRVVERAVKTTRPVPSGLTRELGKLARTAPASVAGLGAFFEMVVTLVQRGHVGKSPMWELERFYDVDDWPTVLAYRREQPSRMFAAITPMNVRLYLIEDDRLALVEVSVGAMKDGSSLFTGYGFDAGGVELLKRWLDTDVWLIEEETQGHKLPALVGVRLHLANENVETMRAIAAGRVAVH